MFEYIPIKINQTQNDPVKTVKDQPMKMNILSIPLKDNQQKQIYNIERIKYNQVDYSHKGSRSSLVFELTEGQNWYNL